MYEESLKKVGGEGNILWSPLNPSFPKRGIKVPFEKGGPFLPPFVSWVMGGDLKKGKTMFRGFN